MQVFGIAGAVFQKSARNEVLPRKSDSGLKVTRRASSAKRVLGAGDAELRAPLRKEDLLATESVVPPRLSGPCPALPAAWRPLLATAPACFLRRAGSNARLMPLCRSKPAREVSP